MAEPIRSLHNTAADKPDIPALMASIRARIAADVETNRDKHPVRPPLATKHGDEGVYRSGALEHSEELRFLNLNYAFETRVTPDAIKTHRGGLIGKLIVRAKRKFVSYLRAMVLNDYLTGEREFQEHLVRFLNQVSRHGDARDFEIIKRLERDLGNLNTRLNRIDDDKNSGFAALEYQAAANAADMAGRIENLDALVRGLEGIVKNFGVYTSPDAPHGSESHEKIAERRPDPGYLLLENRFRGAENEIAARLAIYPEIFKKAPGPVLEIGSGRGELQRLFQKAGVDSYGIDLDMVMVNVANANGAKTKHGDGIAHLRALPDGSLGGLIAVQVVEHLTREQLHELCDLAKRKLKKGGRAVFETINPQSLLALSSNYFRDPTHVWPMHPDTLGYMATLAGLKIVETRYLSPVPPNALLKEIPIDTAHTPIVADALRRVNRVIGQLNQLLYGFQDYCLILEGA